MNLDLSDVYEKIMCEAFQCDSKRFRFVNRHYYEKKWRHPKALAAYLHCAMIEMMKRDNDDDDYQKCVDMLDNSISKENVRTVLNVMKVKYEKEINA